MNQTDRPLQAQLRDAEAQWSVKSDVGRLRILIDMGAPLSEADALCEKPWEALSEGVHNMVLEWAHNNPVGYFNSNKPEPLHINL